MQNKLPKMLVCFLVWCFAYAVAQKPPVLFAGTRANYAWVRVHEGWLIDSSGAIRKYSFAASDSVGYFNQADTMSMQIYNKLLAKSAPTGRTVSADTLLAMQALTESASEGVVSFERLCADFGLFRYSAFRYDTHASRVKEVICYQFGDQTACNSSAEAKKIARWLNSIDTMRISSCIPPDSCLNPSTTIAPVKSASVQKMRQSPQATFDLSGKRADCSARQIMVGKGGKIPLKF